MLSILLPLLAISCGSAQAADADAKITTGQYKWVLAYIGRTTNELVSDHRFGRLLNSVVPEQQVLLVGKTTSLRRTFRKMLTDAPDFVTMKENRFIVFSGKDKNLPEDKALVWLDWRTGRS